MLHSQDNLHAAPRSSELLSAGNITTLLPCDEEDFVKAQEPRSRAALQDTPPALESPSLIVDKGRSLFAALIQVQYLWGTISRLAINHNKSSRPWDPTSEYAQMKKRIQEWENGLPEKYRWSPDLLDTYKREGQDLVCCDVAPVVLPSSRRLMLAAGVPWGDYDHPSVSHRHSESVYPGVRIPMAPW